MPLPTKAEVEQWFTHGPDDPGKDLKFTALHEAGRQFALEAISVLPDSHEAERTLDAIQEAVMWATAAISRA